MDQEAAAGRKCGARPAECGRNEPPEPFPPPRHLKSAMPDTTFHLPRYPGGRSMPIYEYECQQCGKVFETIQKFSDPRLTECLCEEKGPVTKLISAAAFHLKGTGWYVTDFRDKGKKGGDKKEEGGGDSGDKAAANDGAKDGAKDGGKSESAPKKDSGGDSKPAAAAD